VTNGYKFEKLTSFLAISSISCEFEPDRSKKVIATNGLKQAENKIQFAAQHSYFYSFVRLFVLNKITFLVLNRIDRKKEILFGTC
jgi:hypothetical protein